MTTRQQEALEFIRAKQRVVTIGPSLRELAAALGIAANAAQQKVEFLRREGLVEANTGQGIVIVDRLLHQQAKPGGFEFVEKPKRKATTLAPAAVKAAERKPILRPSGNL